jgi:cell wall-associated NlpC family hydrolase
MSGSDAAERECVIACARGWVGTPFHDLARVKGVGVDCAQLLAGAFEEAKIVPHVETGFYSAQFFCHHSDERLAAFVLLYAHEIAESAVGPGDVVLYRVGRSFSHAAIVVDWPGDVIHAHKLSGKVVEMRGDVADLEGRPTRFFSVWG